MNIAIAQSGGPTAAINSSLCGVFDEAEKYNEIDRIYGSINGIEGILNDNLIDLKEVLITENDKQLLKRTPSEYLSPDNRSIAGNPRFHIPAHYPTHIL